jgi:multiple antibiotic resistance protein
MFAWVSFLLSFGALLPVINPPAGALLFLGLIGEQPSGVYRSMARKIALINIVFLFIIQVVGAAIFRFFGISLPIVQVAGGIITASIGWSMLNQADPQARSRTKQETAECVTVGCEDWEEKAFYPFTFPVTSDPATLVVTITLSAQAANPLSGSGVARQAGLLAAIVALSALVYLCYAYAPMITKAISPSTVHGFVRVTAFILFCIGVQICWNGLAVLLPTVMR